MNDARLDEVLADNENLRRELAVERAERERLEDQLCRARRVETAGKLASGAAHDITNMLAIVAGHSALMLRRLGPDDPLRRNADGIKQAAAYGIELVRRLLETRQPETLATEVSVNPAVRSVGRILQPLLGEGIELTLHLSPDLGPVRVHPGQLEQVVMNLVLNARDAMPRGGRVNVVTANVQLDADATRGSRGPLGAYVLLAVSDTGSGMDAVTRTRLFEPYFTTKAPGKGTGLGLATVQEIVRQNGGHIAVSSALGQGTTFMVYLPRVEAGEADVPREAVAPLGVETVLVVDDEEEVRGLIREILQLQKYTVLDARDGAEALAISEGYRGPIDLVVVDREVSGLPAETLVRRLTAARPDLRALYVSGQLDADVDGSFSRRPRWFLSKPFTVDVLARKVREVLDAPAE